ncbi:hypothetical protein MB84_28960 (plasmid) [Pandoraea oxalativorans]|uniref:Uncharacterized protein n=1 Tax=Pandoraea oxalativorans TaxID=573737 RepID=A0A0G3ICA1_9BURK|nr:hypothetical protein MB84_28960 [Pandoraea oxalativorans]
MTLEHLMGEANRAVGGQRQGRCDHRGFDLRIHAMLGRWAPPRDCLQGGFAARLVRFFKSIKIVA